MSEILDIKQLRELAEPTIEIPNFDNAGTIKVRLQKPRLMAMAAQGKIPNHLMGIATDMIVGTKNKAPKKSEKDRLKDIFEIYELYCTICMVEPTYEEMKYIITDEQQEAIFLWATGQVKQLNNFRTNKGNGTSNNNGEEVQQKTE